MSRKMKYTTLVVIGLIVLLGGYLIKFGLYPQFFDIKWQ